MDFIVEILSKKTESRDRGIKKDDYAAHGVREYWIIDPRPGRRTIEQYLLNEDGEYELRAEISQGKVSCVTVEGFSLDIEAIFDEQAAMGALTELVNG